MSCPPLPQCGIPDRNQARGMEHAELNRSERRQYDTRLQYEPSRSGKTTQVLVR
jgi:hypothetical protein